MTQLQNEFLEGHTQSHLRGSQDELRKHGQRNGTLTGAAPTGRAPTRPALPEKERPLIVDLDGTLVRSDLLIETAFWELGRRPHSIVNMVRALLQGKASLKHRLSEAYDFDPSVLPYDEVVVSCVRAAAAQGRPVYLASASHERIVSAVADHLGLFTGWFATDATTNCTGENKAEKLVATFGQGGFDYIGNAAADLPIWRRAAKSCAIRAPASVMSRLSRECDNVERLAHDRPTWRTWARLLRVHQYAKNVLVFLPLLANQLFGWDSVLQALIAAVAFSICASGVYILNDLIDLQDDRVHRTKCYRPLACGQIPLAHAVVAFPALLFLSLAVASAISSTFFAVLAGYFVLTTAYSLLLKRKMILDVLALAVLYTMRVIGGAVALSAPVSPLLLAFVLSWFLSLALVKRYVELIARQEAGLPDSKSRGYRNADRGMVGALAVAAGSNGLMLFALYVSSETVRDLYSRPEALWLIGPVLTYWIARVLMLAHRGLMHDDPLVFALKDKVSLATLGVAGAFVLCAV